MRRNWLISRLAFPAILFAATLPAFVPRGGAADFTGPAREMRAQLAEKILPYWFDTAQDTNQGGYLLADDAVHGRQQPAEKQIVTQSRMIWGFSRAQLAGFSNTNRNYLRAATQGYHFLLDHFQDRQDGGYFWSTDLNGKPVNDGKFLYGESFAIYALVEYYRASGDPGALSHALELYQTVQAFARRQKRRLVRARRPRVEIAFARRPAGPGRDHRQQKRQRALALDGSAG